MKKLIILLVLFFVANHLFGQSDSAVVAFVAYWKVGDSYDFFVTKQKKQWRNDSLTKDEKLQYKANFKVIDSTKDSYTIKWTFENDLLNTYKTTEELKEKLSKYKMTEVVYMTNELGEFIEITNWKKIAKMMGAMVNDVVEVLTKNESQEKQNTVKTAMQAYSKMYSSKEGIEQLVLKELQLIHFPMGVDFDVTEPLIYDDALPNFFGGDPIATKTKIFVDKVNFKDNLCTLKQEQNLNQEDSKKLIGDFLKNSNLQNKEIEEKFKSAAIEIKDNNTYEFYFNPGVPKRIETERTTFFEFDKEKISGIDKTIIELVD